MDSTILAENLNKQVGLERFFGAFGYKQNDDIFFRLFRDDVKGQPGKKQKSKPGQLNSVLPVLRKYNQKNYGVFFVVNGGGNSDQEVKQAGIARAQFMEIDPSKEELKKVEAGEITLEDLLKRQLEEIADFALEPSVIVRTRKSLHTYWLLDGGEIGRFRGLQERLIAYFDSDSSIKNESKVMRVPGFEHRKSDPVEVCIIKFDPDLRYTQDQIEAVLDLFGATGESKPDPQAQSQDQAQRQELASGEKIPKGNGRRYDYCESRCGFYVGKLGDSVDAESILLLVQEDFRNNCEDPDDTDTDFRDTFLPVIRKFQKRSKADQEPNEEWKYNRLAWLYYNPGKDFDPGHGSGSWDEARECGNKAREEGFLLDDLFPATAPQTAGGQEGGSDRTTEADPDSPPASLAEIFGAEALVDVIADYRSNIPEKQWVIDGVCTEGECAIISGSSKSGKSYLMTNLAITTARGGKWLGRFQ